MAHFKNNVIILLNCNYRWITTYINVTAGEGGATFFQQAVSKDLFLGQPELREPRDRVAARSEALLRRCAVMSLPGGHETIETITA